MLSIQSPSIENNLQVEISLYEEKKSKFDRFTMYYVELCQMENILQYFVWPPFFMLKMLCCDIFEI